MQQMQPFATSHRLPSPRFKFQVFKFSRFRCNIWSSLMQHLQRFATFPRLLSLRHSLSRSSPTLGPRRGREKDSQRTRFSAQSLPPLSPTSSNHSICTRPSQTTTPVHFFFARSSAPRSATCAPEITAANPPPCAALQSAPGSIGSPDRFPDIVSTPAPSFPGS